MADKKVDPMDIDDIKVGVYLQDAGDHWLDIVQVVDIKNDIVSLKPIVDPRNYHSHRVTTEMLIESAANFYKLAKGYDTPLWKAMHEKS